MRKQEEIENMYDNMLEIQANNIECSKEMDGWRRALYWVLNEDIE